MKFTALLLFLFLAGTLIARGQPREKAVTGTVTDAVNDEPMPGVNVLVEGTTTGATTDSNGKFSLQRPTSGAIITFSFIGYATEKITYSGQQVIDVKLSQSLTELDQAVVIGYGTVRKSDLTGSVASVNSSDIEKSRADNLQSALQGRVAGLMVTANSGGPASEPVVRIRGIGTVNNNDPIYVVDGMIVDKTAYDGPNMIYLNPWDISSIEVLKDASAQAIYGSRGANGVILITTKKGSEGSPKITFNASVGVNNLARVPKTMNREEFMDYVETAFKNGYLRTYPDSGSDVTQDILAQEFPTYSHALTEYNTGVYTDWIKEVVKGNAINQNYNLELSGGAKSAHYLASAGYLNNQGLVNNWGFKRYAFRLNTDFRHGDHITIGENLGITSASRKGYLEYASPFGNALFGDPLAPVLKPESEISVQDPNYQYDKYAPSLITNGNPALEVELTNVLENKLTLVGNVFTDISIFKDLVFHSSFGFNNVFSDWSQFDPYYTLAPGNGRALNRLITENHRINGWVWENTLTYKKSFGDHSLTALVGYTSEYTKSAIQNASKLDSPENDPEMQTFNAAISQPNVSGTYNIVSMLSYLGRINYSFLDRYLLTASIRRDGSSKFGAGYRWGNFPSFSLAWKISEERFLKNSNLFSNLKIRAGWGQIGNSSLPVTDAYISLVGSVQDNGWDTGNRYILGENVYTGYYINRLGTPDISWETTEQTNIGIDIGILKNKLTLTADYYIKNTKDMLLQVPMPLYAGYPGAGMPFTNAGSVQNKGFEFLIDFRENDGDFRFGASINLAMFKNKVTSLGNENRPIIYGINRTEVGRPIGCFYSLETDGIFQTEAEVQSYTGPDDKPVQPDAHAGDFRFKNLNGDNDINGLDYTWIGNPWPKLTYGATLTFGFRSFDLLAFFQGSYGNAVYASGLQRQFDFVPTGNMFKYIYDNAWRGPGTSQSQPIISSVDDNDNFKSSDYFVEDGSYLRLKNLQIGYNLPKKLCEKVRIINARIWIGGANLLTITKYRGIDPETASGAGASPLAVGYADDYLYPMSREISLGVSMSF